MQECNKLIVERIDQLLNENLELIALNKECIESEQDKRDFELLEQRLLGANEALLEIRFRL